jgi:hypothetical protein
VRRIIPNFTPYGHLKQVPTNFKAAGSSTLTQPNKLCMSTQHDCLSKPGAKMKTLPIRDFGWILKIKRLERCVFFISADKKIPGAGLRNFGVILSDCYTTSGQYCIRLPVA